MVRMIEVLKGKAMEDININMSVSAQAPDWENGLLYADLKHSSGTKKPSPAPRAIRKYTNDDRVLYSDVKHSAASNTAQPASMSPAESTPASGNIISQQPCIIIIMHCNRLRVITTTMYYHTYRD